MSSHTNTADEDWDAGRAERLLRIPAAEIVHYSYETILDWLDARREQRIACLRAACQTLREQNQRQERAHARLAAALAVARALTPPR